MPDSVLLEISTIEDALQKPTNKRSYASMSQKHVDRVVDVKILEYLSNSKSKKSIESLDTMA